MLLKAFARNSAVFAASAVIKGLLGFIIIALFTRLLSPAEFGDYAVVIAIVGVADMAGFLWIRHILMRHIDDTDKPQDKVALSNAGAIYIVVMIVMALGVALMAVGPFGGIFALLILAEGVSNFAILMARLRLKIMLFSALSIFKPLMALLVGVGFITAGYGVSGALWGIVVSFSLAGIIGLIALPDFRAMRVALVEVKEVRAILGFGLPLIAVLAAQSVIRATDRVLLETLMSGDITGLYAAAQDIPYKLLTILASAVHLAAYPLAVKALDNEGRKGCRAQLRQNFAVLYAVIAPAALGIIMTAPSLSVVLLGAEFRGFAVQYLGVFTLIAVMNCVVQYYCVLPFHLEKKTHLLIVPFVLAMVMNAAIGFVAIPIWGAQGAIIGSAAAYVFLCGACVFAARGVFSLPFPLMPFIKITLAGLGMAGVLMVFDFGDDVMGLVMSVIMGVGVYAAFSIMFNFKFLRGRL